jgi:hypothetical protein
MGTRSLTYVFDNETPVVCMYRQFDGYPSGHGSELARFLDGFEVVNGYNEKKPKLANGMGCLAAQMIVYFKGGVGGFYLEPVELGQDCSQDYEYHVYRDKVKILDGDQSELFSGSWQEFYDHCTVKETA